MDKSRLHRPGYNPAAKSAPKVINWVVFVTGCMVLLLLLTSSCTSSRLAGEGDEPPYVPCERFEQVDKGSWLEKKRDSLEAYRIVRFPYRSDGWAYHLEGPVFTLYDCQGTLLCSHAMQQATSCMHYIKPSQRREAAIIYNRID